MDRYSIYIHLPFCRTKCRYCDFHSIETLEVPFLEYTKSLFEEWRYRKKYFENCELTSIYFGGGTPSLWPHADFVGLLKGFPVSDELEVTVEVNPGDGSGDWFARLADSGVNRFSIGAQAFDDGRLEWLGRRHDSKAAVKAIEAARKCARSVGVDLIYGTPGQGKKGLLEELGILSDLGVNHVSAYELTVSEGTPLFASVEKGDVVIPGDDEMADLWHWLGEVLGGRGYDRYEVSNYAVPAHRCRHNSHYWQGGVYMGLGAGAHGFSKDDQGGLFRYSNSQILEEYLGFMENEQPRMDGAGIGENGSLEVLDILTHSREKMMLGLRTKDGIVFERAFEGLPTEIRAQWMKFLKTAQVEGLVSISDRRAVPTEKGMLHADTLAARFF